MMTSEYQNISDRHLYYKESASRYGYMATDIDYKKYKKEQQTAIENLDFKQAEECQIQIAKLDDANHKRNIEAIEKKFIDNCASLHLDYLRKRKSINKIFHKREVKIREEISDSYEKLVQLHLLQLSQYDDRMFDMYLSIIKEHKDDGFHEVIEKAKQLAYQGKYTDANNMLLEAGSPRNNKLEDMEEMFVKTYNSRIKPILSSQSTELVDLARNLDAELSRLHIRKNDRYRRLDRNFKLDLDTQFYKALGYLRVEYKKFKKVITAENKKSFESRYHDFLRSINFMEGPTKITHDLPATEGKEPESGVRLPEKHDSLESNTVPNGNEQGVRRVKFNFCDGSAVQSHTSTQHHC